jgi:putative CocE/NonD family hydrolase
MSASWSEYVSMPDGSLLATDVYLPDSANKRAPCAIMGARYWREFVLGSSAPQQLDRDLLLSSGFAIVIYDLRGTGASFGAWEGMCSPTEIGDMSNMISWVTAQPWSNGLVISRGQSYAANVAELSTASKAPGHIAAVARFPDLDLSVTSFGREAFPLDGSQANGMSLLGASTDARRNRVKRVRWWGWTSPP